MTRVGGPPVAGRYELIEDFGPDERFAGGRVRTWQARDLQANRPVVLRLISPGGASARLLLDRALELSLLAHPALGMIHDVVDHGGYGIVVGEWVPGVPLADLLDVEGPLEPPKVRDLVGGIAEAVADAHHAGLPIGGLRTERVVVRADGSGALVGAPALFADERGDIAGLGELLYTALTGNTIGPGRPDPRTAMHRGIPRELAALALRAMDSDPTRQLATAAAFATVLRPRSRPTPREPAAAAERTTRRLLGPDADAAGHLPGGGPGMQSAASRSEAAQSETAQSETAQATTSARSDTAPTPIVAPGTAAAAAGQGAGLAAGPGAGPAAGPGAGDGSSAPSTAPSSGRPGADPHPTRPIHQPGTDPSDPSGAADLAGTAGAADPAGTAGAAKTAEPGDPADQPRASGPGTDPYGPHATTPAGFADRAGAAAGETGPDSDWLVHDGDPGTGTGRGARGVRGWFDRGRAALSRDGSDRDDDSDDWDSYDDDGDGDGDGDSERVGDRNDLPLGWSSDIWEGDEEWDDDSDDGTDDGPDDGSDRGTGAPPDSDRGRGRTAAGLGGAALVGSLFGRAGRRSSGGRDGRGGPEDDGRTDAAAPSADGGSDRNDEPDKDPDTDPAGHPAAPPGASIRAGSDPVPEGPVPGPVPEGPVPGPVPEGPVPAGPPLPGPDPTAPIPTAPVAAARTRATAPVPTGADRARSEPGDTGATEPSATEPSATEPSATEPSATEPSATEPSAAERAARRRRVLMLAVPAIALILVIALAVFIGGRIGSGGDDDEVADASTTSAESSSAELTTEAPAPPAPGPLVPTSATVYNPFGDGQPENEDDVGLSYDGDPATGWSTATYQGSPEFGNLKPGVGLLYDLGAERSITAVELATSLPGTALEIRVGGTPDAALDSYPVVATVDPLGPTASAALAEPATARYVLVWFVRLTEDDGGFTATLSECRILGT